MKKIVILSQLFCILFSHTVFATYTPQASMIHTSLLLSVNTDYSSCEVSVVFKNTGCNELDVFWDNQGKHVFYSSLRPTETRNQITYRGHSWVFKAKSTIVYRWTAADCRNTKVDVNSKGCTNGRPTNVPNNSPSNPSSSSNKYLFEQGTIFLSVSYTHLTLPTICSV